MLMNPTPGGGGAMPAAPAPAAAPMPPQGGMPQGAMPQQGPGNDEAMQMAQAHIDPNNPLQQLILKRLDALTPQDGEALVQMSPQAAEALKKVLPEIAFVIDMMVLGQQPGGGGGMAPGGPEMTGMPPGGQGTPPMPPMPPAPAAPGQSAMPQSRLSGLGA